MCAYVSMAQGESMLPFNSKAICWLIFLFLEESVCSIQDLNCLDEAHPLHIIKRNLPYSEHTTLNVSLKKKIKVSLIHNTLTERFRIIFDQISGHCGSANLTQN